MAGALLDPELVAGRADGDGKCDRCGAIAAVDATGERGVLARAVTGALEGDTRLAGDVAVRSHEPDAVDPGWSLRRAVREGSSDAMRDLRRQGLLPTDLDGVLREDGRPDDAAGTLRRRGSTGS